MNIEVGEIENLALSMVIERATLIFNTYWMANGGHTYE
jgi:hypothetical protein